MRIIGCDYHPSWQQICWMETSTGETGEQKLEHASGEAERFYRRLPEHVLMGMESAGNCQWFVELLTALGHELWIGDAAKIRASDSRQQKRDRRDAALLLKLLLEGRFPRIWTGHRAGLRANHGRGLSFSARETGGQLSGTDSARVQFRRQATAGLHQQAGKSIPADAVGGSRTERGALRSPDAE